MKPFFQKALAVLAVLAVIFGAGYYAGYNTNRDIDPEDYIQTVFTPYESGIDAYLNFLDGTKKSLRIAVYELSEPRIVDKVLELREKRGIKDIKFLLDKSQTVARSGPYEQAQIKRLRDAGIEVVIGTSAMKHNIMHLKLTVRDGIWVEDGSWNYSKSANTQANNLNFIKSPKRAKHFLANWQQMYDFMSKQDQEPWLHTAAAKANAASKSKSSRADDDDSN